MKKELRDYQRPKLYWRWLSIKRFFKNIFRSKRKYEIDFDKVDPNDSAITFNIKNRSETDVITARLFGSVKDLFDKEKSEFIDINVLESSHEKVKLHILSDTIIVKCEKIVSKNSLQLINHWSIYRERMTGLCLSRIYYPVSDRLSTDNLANVVSNPKLEIYLDKNTFIEIPLNPLEDMTIMFRIKEEFNFFNSIRRSFFLINSKRNNNKKTK